MTDMIVFFTTLFPSEPEVQQCIRMMKIGIRLRCAHVLYSSRHRAAFVSCPLNANASVCRVRLSASPVNRFAAEAKRNISPKFVVRPRTCGRSRGAPSWPTENNPWGVQLTNEQLAQDLLLDEKRGGGREEGLPARSVCM